LPTKKKSHRRVQAKADKATNKELMQRLKADEGYEHDMRRADNHDQGKTATVEVHTLIPDILNIPSMVMVDQEEPHKFKIDDHSTLKWLKTEIRRRFRISLSLGIGLLNSNGHFLTDIKTKNSGNAKLIYNCRIKASQENHLLMLLFRQDPLTRAEAYARGDC